MSAAFLLQAEVLAMESAVEAKDIIKDFGEIRALDGLSFKVRRGEIYGLIGPNGAGKTTGLRIVSTLLLPTSGTVKVFGHDAVDEALEVRRLISYLPEEAGAYKNLSGYEYLEFMTKFTTENKEAVKETVEVAARISGLEEKPKLAVLDEPTSGLDVLHSVHVRGIIKQYVERQGVTVLLSSHNMLEVEHLCDRVALINQGKMVAEGSPAELKKNANVSNLEEVFAKVVGLA